MRKNSILKAVAPVAMMLLAARTLSVNFRGCVVSAADVISCHQGSSSKLQRLHSFRGGSQKQLSEEEDQQQKIYRTLQVQVVHRHGDRTPITPLKDEEFWASTLIPPPVLEKISDGTKVLTTGEKNTHAAGGRGPFGKLTQLGLLQLVELGNRLREELVSDKYHDDHEAYETDPHNDNHKLFRYPWTPKRPLSPRNIKVVSTNFPRTLQSAQGLLLGLFPDGTGDETIQIDARHTDVLIPDPQPRRTPEQETLEKELASQPHLKLKEKEMRPIAIRVTEALKDSLGEGALGVSFGVGEEQPEDEGNSNNQQPQPLSWAQLSEITKCLQVRDRLPSSITPQDQEVISKHTAWRWFESLRHPRLAYLAMNPMVSTMVDSMHQHDKEPPVIVYSAHDSTLIGLMCGFRLEQPAQWPEYGSYLKLELLEVTTGGDDKKEHVVRFSLNGSPLRSMWDDDKPLKEIPLDMLAHKVKTEGAVA